MGCSPAVLLLRAFAYGVEEHFEGWYHASAFRNVWMALNAILKNTLVAMTIARMTGIPLCGGLNEMSPIVQVFEYWIPSWWLFKEA